MLDADHYEVGVNEARENWPPTQSGTFGLIGCLELSSSSFFFH